MENVKIEGSQGVVLETTKAGAPTAGLPLGQLPLPFSPVKLLSITGLKQPSVRAPALPLDTPFVAKITARVRGAPPGARGGGGGPTVVAGPLALRRCKAGAPPGPPQNITVEVPTEGGAVVARNLLAVAWLRPSDKSCVTMYTVEAFDATAGTRLSTWTVPMLDPLAPSAYHAFTVNPGRAAGAAVKFTVTAAANRAGGRPARTAGAWKLVRAAHMPEGAAAGGGGLLQPCLDVAPGAPPEDIYIYRDEAGGATANLTSVVILHPSADAGVCVTSYAVELFRRGGGAGALEKVDGAEVPTNNPRAPGTVFYYTNDRPGAALFEAGREPVFKVTPRNGAKAGPPRLYSGYRVVRRRGAGALEGCKEGAPGAPEQVQLAPYKAAAGVLEAVWASPRDGSCITAYTAKLTDASGGPLDECPAAAHTATSFLEEGASAAFDAACLRRLLPPPGAPPRALGVRVTSFNGQARGGRAGAAFTYRLSPAPPPLGSGGGGGGAPGGACLCRAEGAPDAPALMTVERDRSQPYLVGLSVSWGQFRRAPALDRGICVDQYRGICVDQYRAVMRSQRGDVLNTQFVKVPPCGDAAASFRGVQPGIKVQFEITPLNGARAGAPLVTSFVAVPERASPLPSGSDLILYPYPSKVLPEAPPAAGGGPPPEPAAAPAGGGGWSAAELLGWARSGGRPPPPLCDPKLKPKTRPAYC
ncbi:MAG: hypothetical protein J3K34DRAFT_523144 [Monoraphidium minutum]|nr:MAG: hypothetical protein J3K34DRAFT_523144 [Monoraphidium minutum]